MATECEQWMPPTHTHTHTHSYLITQFRSVGLEVTAFTGGGITDLTAVLVAGAVLLVCDLLGGMRAVAYSDVLQGCVLFLGSIIFLVIQVRHSCEVLKC
jgi:Na+(H+)/acetate symporter ActP